MFEQVERPAAAATSAFAAVGADAAIPLTVLHADGGHQGRPDGERAGTAAGLQLQSLCGGSPLQLGKAVF